MMNLKTLFTTPLNKERIPKWIPIVLLAVAIIGFADATYLTIEHYRNRIPPCTTSGCEVVLTSPYSNVLGIPVSLAGALYYLLVSILLLVFLDTKNEKVLRATLFFTTLGFIASLWFLYLQAFVISAYCQYCLVSAATSTFLFVISAYTIKKYREPVI